MVYVLWEIALLEWITAEDNAAFVHFNLSLKVWSVHLMNFPLMLLMKILFIILWLSRSKKR